jgi:5-methylcytosine-specific restriction endonuclease McrA
MATERHCVDCRESMGIVHALTLRCSTCRQEHRRQVAKGWKSRADRGTRCRSRRRTLRPCPRCGGDFWPWANGVSHARKFCCKAAPRPKLPKQRRTVQPKECVWCHETFAGVNARQTACSKTCRQRYQSRRRKLRLRGLNPTVMPIAALYRRDDGICGICNRPVDKGLRYPHPMSATIDHVVPITKGGEHEPHNLQLAHARCNIAKGNRLAWGGAKGSPPASRIRVGGPQGIASFRRESESALEGR